MSTLKIKYASAPQCKAEIDGVEKNIVILGNRGGNLLIRDTSDNTLYELRCPYGGADCTIQMDVVGKEFTVTVVNNAENATVADLKSKTVEEGGDVTFKLAYASGKSASDISVEGGTLSGDTITVSNVTSATTVTITDVTPTPDPDPDPTPTDDTTPDTDATEGG